jgi:hypothetical protein
MAVASAKTPTKNVRLTFASMKSSIRTLIEVGNDQFWYLAEQLEELFLRLTRSLPDRYADT